MTVVLIPGLRGEPVQHLRVGRGVHRLGLAQRPQAVGLLGGGQASGVGAVEVAESGADRRQRLTRGRGLGERLAGNAHGR